MSRDADRVLARLIRVRQVRARLATAALGRNNARRLAEAALRERVALLVAGGGVGGGRIAADLAKARAGADAVLGRLADDVGQRLARSEAGQRQLGEALGRARAAVDAAVARRIERETEREMDA